MATVYILFSKSVNRHYIGSCLDLEKRIEEHRLGAFNTGFTKRASDWDLVFVISELSYQQSRAIEIHIKNMKSVLYISNLQRYPEMVEKLVLKYKED